MSTDAAQLLHQDIARQHLLDDPRWLLVQRIVHSGLMRRATHLKKILLYVAEESLLHPDRLIREQDIAQDVLGRRDDFDPAYDTIVRVQIGHLRAKLQAYFDGEGSVEPLRLLLPRGSYRTVFEEAPTSAVSSLPAPPAVDPPAAVTGAASPPPPPVWLRMAAGTAAAAVLLTAGIFLWTSHRAALAEDNTTAQKMFPFLRRGGGKVAVVLPDTSLLLLQKTLDTEIPVETYTQTSSRLDLALEVKDEQMHQLMSLLGRVRTTTLDEASVGTDFLQALTRDGIPAELRYARDLHIRDFGQGSYILIGNQRSDPWVTLFAARNNFQYSGTPAGAHYSFHNLRPSPGEQVEYKPDEGQVESYNYADVTLTPNLTDSGYVLMIIGSDVPANEAAARFLMGGELPPDIDRILHNRNLRSLEILLRGHHLHGESNDKIAIVAYRVVTR